MPYLADGTGHQAADTSQEAAERIAPDANHMRALVLDALDAIGDMTADEIAYLSDERVWSIRPRVTELYQRGYIERTGERRKNLSGASANVYRRRITDTEEPTVKTLTTEQAQTLSAFLDAFDQTTTGAWARIEAHMAENWGIRDPETALEAARDALQ